MAIERLDSVRRERGNDSFSHQTTHSYKRTNYLHNAYKEVHNQSNMVKQSWVHKSATVVLVMTSEISYLFSCTHNKNWNRKLSGHLGCGRSTPAMAALQRHAPADVESPLISSPSSRLRILLVFASLFTAGGCDVKLPSGSSRFG